GSATPGGVPRPPTPPARGHAPRGPFRYLTTDVCPPTGQTAPQGARPPLGSTGPGRQTAPTRRGVRRRPAMAPPAPLSRSPNQPLRPTRGATYRGCPERVGRPLAQQPSPARTGVRSRRDRPPG